MKALPGLALFLFLITARSEAGTYSFDKNVVVGKQAIEERDRYIAVFGGFSFYDNFGTEFQFVAPNDGPFFQGNINVSRNPGWIAGIALGTRKSRNWRFETEFSHHQSSGGNFSAVVTGSGNFNLQGPFSGDIVTNSLMINAVKDFGSGKLRPYLGAGAGLSWVDVQLSNNPAFSLQADDLELGYQVFGGLSYHVSERLSIFGEYRLTGHGDIGPASYSLTPPNFQSQIDLLDLGISSHVILGLRLDF